MSTRCVDGFRIRGRSLRDGTVTQLLECGPSRWPPFDGRTEGPVACQVLTARSWLIDVGFETP